MRTMQVFDYEKQPLGTASNYKQVKELHLSSMPEDLKKHYAGVDLEYKGNGNMCRPAYYVND